MEKVKQRAFLLRLSPSLREEAVLLAKSEGISLNHFISIALAERMVRLEVAHAALLERKVAFASSNRFGTPAARGPAPVGYARQKSFPLHSSHSGQ